MIRSLTYLLSLLYCFIWIRIELPGSTVIPLQRALSWCALGFLLLKIAADKSFRLSRLSLSYGLIALSFLLYLCINFYFLSQNPALNYFNKLYFLMDFSKYVAIFGCGLAFYYALKFNLLDEFQLQRNIIRSGATAIYLTFFLLLLYLAGFRTLNETFIRSFGGALGVWPSDGLLPRLAGPTAEPQQFSVILVTPILLMFSRPYIQKFWWSGVFGIVALLLSQSKFALVSLPLIGLYLFLLYPKKRIYFVFAGILLLPALLFVFAKLPTFSTSLEQGGESGAFTERLENLNLLGEIIKNYFWLGIGAGQYGSFRGLELFNDPAYLPSYYPNLDQLKVFAETGLIGFLLIAALFITFFTTFFFKWKRLWGFQREIYGAFLLGSFAIFLNMLIGYELLHIFLWINLGYLLYATESYHERLFERPLPDSNPDRSATLRLGDSESLG